MSITLVVIAAIAVIAWYISTMKKIDRDEAKALQTPGTATFLRNNFGDFISEVLKNKDNYITFERSDQIKFAKKNSNKELVIGNFMDYGGSVMSVVVLDNKMVVSEMKFKKGTNANDISSKVLQLFV